MPQPSPERPLAPGDSRFLRVLLPVALAAQLAGVPAMAAVPAAGDAPAPAGPESGFPPLPALLPALPTMAQANLAILTVPAVAAARTALHLAQAAMLNGLQAGLQDTPEFAAAQATLQQAKLTAATRYLEAARDYLDRFRERGHSTEALQAAYGILVQQPS
jgi:hypothetical protein